MVVTRSSVSEELEGDQNPTPRNQLTALFLDEAEVEAVVVAAEAGVEGVAAVEAEVVGVVEVEVLVVAEESLNDPANPGDRTHGVK